MRLDWACGWRGQATELRLHMASHPDELGLPMPHDAGPMGLRERRAGR